VGQGVPAGGFHRPAAGIRYAADRRPGHAGHRLDRGPDPACAGLAAGCVLRVPAGAQPLRRAAFPAHLERVQPGLHRPAHSPVSGGRLVIRPPGGRLCPFSRLAAGAERRRDRPGQSGLRSVSLHTVLVPGAQHCLAYLPGGSCLAGGDSAGPGDPGQRVLRPRRDPGRAIPGRVCRVRPAAAGAQRDRRPGVGVVPQADHLSARPAHPVHALGGSGGDRAGRRGLGAAQRREH